MGRGRDIATVPTAGQEFGDEPPGAPTARRCNRTPQVYCASSRAEVVVAFELEHAVSLSVSWRIGITRRARPGCKQAEARLGKLVRRHHRAKQARAVTFW
jgi:hypothetical protein